MKFNTKRHWENSSHSYNLVHSHQIILKLIKYLKNCIKNFEDHINCIRVIVYCQTSKIQGKDSVEYPNIIYLIIMIHTEATET